MKTRQMRASTVPRARRTAVVGALSVTLLSTGLAFGPSALAAVPTAPDNITIFPDRDFISVDGFADHAGQPITIELTRPGQGVIGSATGTAASAAEITAGNPIIEVNHPGGLCWGAGGGVQVTPDIQPGDTAVVKFGNTAAGDTTTQDVAVTDSALEGSRLTVNGRVGPGVDPANLEQRIVQPDLKDDPAVGRRDVRAVPGPLTQSDKGNYQSALEVNGQTFTATYEFDNPETALTASKGQLRAMNWQNTDGDGNRQGITISEFGEAGGPGMGGCPAPAAQQGPLSPTGVTAVQNGANVDVKWTPATQNPGTAAVQGYTVRAVDVTATGGEQNEVGKRTSNPAATTMSLPATLAGKRIEVRTVTQSGESWPPALNGTTAPGGGTGGDPADTTAPVASAAPAGGTFTAAQTVTLTADQPGSQIYYTLDGSDPLEGADQASLKSTVYTAPIPIAPSPAPVVLRYVAFDPAGNASLARTETYTFSTVAGPGAPTAVTATGGDRSATVNWTAPTLPPGASPVTGYQITVTPTGGGAGAPVTATAGAAATAQQITGLTNGVTYSVTVAATNAQGTSTSTPVSVTPAVPTVDRLTVGSARWKLGDFRVDGTGTIAGSRLTLHTGSFTGPVINTGVITVAPPAAGATTGTWSIRLRNGQPPTNPGTIYVTSDKGGRVGPVAMR
jgi:Chitobiase/beta-hexosaminidase C-terminal domain/Fibronectin type III domain